VRHVPYLRVLGSIVVVLRYADALDTGSVPHQDHAEERLPLLHFLDESSEDDGKTSTRLAEVLDIRYQDAVLGERQPFNRSDTSACIQRHKQLTPFVGLPWTGPIC
jgi:hypothetical protein